MALWGEQSDENVLDGLLWPRAASAAEVYWTGASATTNGQMEERSMTEALPRLHDWRYRIVGRGIQATPIQPLWCALRAGQCECCDEREGTSADLATQATTRLEPICLVSGLLATPAPSAPHLRAEARDLHALLLPSCANESLYFVHRCGPPSLSSDRHSSPSLAARFPLSALPPSLFSGCSVRALLRTAPCASRRAVSVRARASCRSFDLCGSSAALARATTLLGARRFGVDVRGEGPAAQVSVRTSGQEE